MNKRREERAKLQNLVTSLEQYEAERALESFKSGSQFDAGIVEGISNAIDKLGFAGNGAEWQSIVQDLSGIAGTVSQEDEADAYARGIAAGTSHVAGVIREELAGISEPD